MERAPGAPDAAAAVRAYAARCRAVLPEEVGVRSYAGLWLLLATLGRTTTGPDRTVLEDALAMPVEEAAEAAARLLAEQRSDLGVAVGGWRREGVALTGTLPVRLDPLPDQDGLDAWVRRSTRGKLSTFPATVTQETVLLLATALVAETRWADALAVDDRGLMVDERGLLAVVDTDDAGLVAVAVPRGRGGLDVVSVVAEPELPSAWVWSAADQVTGWVLDGSLLGRRVPATALEDGHAWRVVRERRRVADGPSEVWDAMVPAWSLDTASDLLRAPGVDAVARAVLATVPGSAGVSCRQSASATYTSEGFAAVAVTALTVWLGSEEDARPVRKLRHVSLRFDRPHAVVAVARGGAWDGVPLVHAWVDATPDEEADSSVSA